METMSHVPRRAAALLLVLLVGLAAVPGIAAADTRSGGTIVIGPGETINDDLQVFGGSVVVQGTVTGDLEVFAGNVFIDGVVNGDLAAFGGSIQIDGEIGGSVEAFGGDIEVGPEAMIGGTLQAAGGNVVLAGTVENDAELAGGTVRVDSTAVVGGDLVTDAETFVQEDGAVIEGAATENADLGIAPTFRGVGLPTVPPVAFAIYGFLVNLVLGAVLLLVFPRLSSAVTERAVGSPLRSGGVGILTLVGVPIVLIIVAITIIGIPLSIIGALLFLMAAWAGAIYGRLAVGSWLLSLVDYDNRWASLLVGLVVVALATRIPFLGWLISGVVLLLGLGALTWVLYATYGGGSGPAMATDEDREAGEGGEEPQPA